MKYYRIIKETYNNSSVVFRVQTCDSWITRLFNWWESYSKENYDFESAINQIKTLHNWEIDNIEILYKTNSKKLKENA